MSEWWDSNSVAICVEKRFHRGYYLFLYAILRVASGKSALSLLALVGIFREISVSCVLVDCSLVIWKVLIVAGTATTILKLKRTVALNAEEEIIVSQPAKPERIVA